MTTKVNYYKQGGHWVVDIVYDEYALSLTLSEATDVASQLLQALQRIHNMEEESHGQADSSTDSVSEV